MYCHICGYEIYDGIRYKQTMDLHISCFKYVIYNEKLIHPSIEIIKNK